MKALMRSLCAIAVVFSASLAQASYLDLIGFPELQSLMGAGIPTGAGVGVHHVEAGSGTAYGPNIATAGFSSQVFAPQSGAMTTLSHANNVGLNFYGTGSIAPQIGNSVANPVKPYRAGGTDGWFDSFLNNSVAAAPLTDSSVRIGNHSYIGQASALTLSRIDFIVEEDDFIQVVGLPNNQTELDNAGIDGSLWKSAYNVISVGRTSGVHIGGTVDMGAPYSAGRVAPTLVTPAFRPDNVTTATSWGTPMVSAAAALLVETAHTQPSLSLNRSFNNRTFTGGNVLYEGESSEVIKATLMAGADRNVPAQRGADLTDYTIDSTNNLDHRYGAGQLNINNSYRIMAAGQHDSVQDGNANDIASRGWDYDPAFGGSSASNTQSSYFFTAAADGTLFASLVWNLDVDIVTSPGFSVGVDLVDLNLEFYDVTGGNTLIVSASSMSTIENTENIYYQGLVAGNRYEMRVVENEASPFLWDYALAWRMELVPEPATSGLILSAIAFLPALRRARHRSQAAPRG